MCILFAIYTFNKSPIDVTDIIISVVEIGQLLSFPFDITENIPESLKPTTEEDSVI